MQLEEKSATNLQTQPQDYSNLVSLLVLFLHSPSPDIELQLARFPPNLYLSLITNAKQHKDVRLACAAAMKSMTYQRQLFQPLFSVTLEHLQNIYISADDSILSGVEGSIQIIIQKIFEQYLDDQNKLKAFESIIQRMNSNADVRNSRLNLRMTKLCVMLVRSMQPNTLNNQICIGGLIFYLKQLYYQKYKVNDAFSVGGRGMEILTNLMVQERSPERYLEQYLETQIQVVQLIQQILMKLEEEGIDETESVPAAYIRNSKQIETLLESILCLNTGGSLLSKNKVVNRLKKEIITLHSDYYLYHISKDFLVVCLNSIINCSANELADESEDIIAEVLQMLERSVCYSDYAVYFYNSTQILMLKLFELVSIREAERSSLEDDPEHFAEMSYDFSMNQESGNVKTRAGSLIYNLCMSIDGNLTFVSHMCLISMHYLQLQAIKQMGLEVPLRDEVIKSEPMMKSLLNLWPKSPEQLTEASILLFSSISDLVLKRPQINKEISTHLTSIHTIFKCKEKSLSFFPPIIVCRYIQLFSFFSFPNCLDPFVPFYSTKPVYQQTILKALETIIHYHNKKQQDMRMYVTHLSTSVLMISEKLTPLLEKTIVTRPEMIVCIKERLIEKLVIWMLKYYEGENMFGCNKISNLLCKVIEKYPDFMVQTDETGFNYDLMALTQYLTPLYKQLINSQRHPAEECIVDIAVAHISCLGVVLDLATARQFLLLAFKVVQNNNYVLNKCLELISHLLCFANMSKNMDKPEFVKLSQVHREIAGELLPRVANWINCLQQERDVDIWQLAYLAQIGLVIVSNQQLVLAPVNFGRLFNYYKTTNCHILRIKIYMVILILFKINPDPNGEAYQFLQSKSLPESIPPYEKSHFTIYLIRIVNLVQSAEYKAYLIKEILKLMYPNVKYQSFLNSYEEKLYCAKNGQGETEIDALQTAKDVLHPLNCCPTDIYKQFKEMFNEMSTPEWESIRKLLGGDIQSMVRDALVREVVGKQPRRILKVKKY